MCVLHSTYFFEIICRKYFQLAIIYHWLLQLAIFLCYLSIYLFYLPINCTHILCLILISARISFSYAYLGNSRKKYVYCCGPVLLNGFALQSHTLKATLIIVRRLFQSSVHAIRSWCRMEGTGGQSRCIQCSIDWWMQYSHWVTESVVGRSVGGYCSGFDQLVCRPYFLLLSGGNCHFISWEGREINARRSLVIYAFCNSRRNARNESRNSTRIARLHCICIACVCGVANVYAWTSVIDANRSFDYQSIFSSENCN